MCVGGGVSEKTYKLSNLISLIKTWELCSADLVGRQLAQLGFLLIKGNGSFKNPTEFREKASEYSAAAEFPLLAVANVGLCCGAAQVQSHCQELSRRMWPAMWHYHTLASLVCKHGFLCDT